MLYSPRFEYIASRTLNFEQGYQNYANDKANYTKSGKLLGTNRGISAIAYQQYLGKEPTLAQIKAITPAIAKAVYYKLFWLPINGDRLKSDGVAWVIFDSFIATGNTATAIKGINKAIGSDKIPYKPYSISSYTTVNQADSVEAINRVIEANIIQRKTGTSQSQQNDYLAGWVDRLNKLRNEALNLAFYTNFKLSDIINQRVRLKKGIKLLNYWKNSSDIGNGLKTGVGNIDTTQNHVSWDSKYPWRVIAKTIKSGIPYVKIKYLLNYKDVLNGSKEKYVEAWFARDNFELY